MNKDNIKKNIAISICVGGSFFLGWFWGDIFQDDTSIEKYAIQQSITKDQKSINLKKMEYIFDYVTTHHIYKDKIDQQQMWENAFSGLVKDIDGGLTQYIPSIKENQVEQQINGSYVGFGITLDKTNDGITYIQNLDSNSQSDEKGLANGDKIIAINDIDVSENGINDISNIMNKESKITVKIQRGDEIIDTELEKDIVVIPDIVHYSKVDEDTHYIKIDSFNDKTVEDLNKVIQTNIPNKKGKSLVIDLRDNYGGTLESYVKIISMFVDKNTLLYSEKSDEGISAIKSSHNKELNFEKYVVLVNQNTASAAELMTSNFKDILNATVIGQKTFGKGSIQTVLNLKDGSHLYITNKEYLTSKSNTIQGIGVIPDFEIDDSIEQYSKAIEISKN